MEGQPEPLLRMEKVSKHFPGVQALDNVDFEVYPGEILGFIGENGAGKSTLVKILSGVYSKDQGTIWFKGQPVEIRSPQEAQHIGISTIYQELALVPHLSVAENIFINREPRRIAAIGMVDFKAMEQQAQSILASMGIEIPVNKKIKELTVAAQQMVEIAKTFSRNANLLLMDEPTSALSSKEVDTLFNLMRHLKERGVSVVFISHRLEEVLSVVDRIIVMRDGRRVGTLPIEGATEDKIIRMMVGREVGLFPKEKAIIGAPVLELKDVSGSNGTRHVSFTVRQGEIVGLAGLVGAGRTELARVICGVDRMTGGEILIEGKKVKIANPSDAVHDGIGWIPEDRKQHGLVLGMDVKQNTTLPIIKRISGLLGLMDFGKEREITADYIQKLSIATPSMSQTVRNLSGGNQQKVVLAKWLSTKPKVLIMDEPTRGIDVGAKSEIYGVIERLASEGIGIVVVSSELPEVMGISDRILVMRQGKIVASIPREEATEEKLLKLALPVL